MCVNAFHQHGEGKKDEVVLVCAVISCGSNGVTGSTRLYSCHMLDITGKLYATTSLLQGKICHYPLNKCTQFQASDGSTAVLVNTGFKMYHKKTVNTVF